MAGMLSRRTLLWTRLTIPSTSCLTPNHKAASVAFQHRSFGIMADKLERLRKYTACDVSNSGWQFFGRMIS